MTEKNRILAKPKRPYKKRGSKGMGDSQGTRKTAPRRRKFLSYEEARVLTSSLGLKNKVEWWSYRKRELTKKRNHLKNIPANPEATYAGKGWKSWGDWLGKGSIRRSKVFRPYKEARKFIRSLNFKRILDWRLYCKGELAGHGRRPDDIPSNPDTTSLLSGYKLNISSWLKFRSGSS